MTGPDVSRETLPPALLRWRWIGCDIHQFQCFGRGDGLLLWVQPALLRSAPVPLTDAWLDENLQAAMAGVQ